MSTGILKIIFQKKNPKYEFLNHLYFGPKFIFQGHLQGFLASFFFFVIFFVIFCRRSTTVTDIFTQPPTRNMKKLPTALSSHNFLLLSMHCVWKSTTINWNFFFEKILTNNKNQFFSGVLLNAQRFPFLLLSMAQIIGEHL